MQDPNEPSEVDMTAPTTLRLSGTAQVIAAMPHMLGFAPKDGDLVIVAFAGKRLSFCMRVDHDMLPQNELAATLAERIASAGSGQVDGAIVILYGDAAFDFDTFNDTFVLAGVPVREIGRVTGQRFFTTLCRDTACCPPEGVLIESNEQADAVFVAAGMAPLASREELEATLAPADDATRALVADALYPTDHVIELFAHLLRSRTPVGPLQAGALIVSLADYRQRDRLLASDELTDDQAINVLSTLVRMAPDGLVAPVASTLAVASYLRGEGARVLIALDRALADDPSYSLARMLAQMLELALPPRALREALAAAAEQLD